MARANKGQKQDERRSVLRVSFEAFERGDVVLARSLAQQVLAGKVGPDDGKVAVELAKQLSAEGAPVAETTAAVAAELVSRTNVAPRTYVFVGAAALTLTLLAIMAAVRY